MADKPLDAFIGHSRTFMVPFHVLRIVSLGYCAIGLGLVTLSVTPFFEIHDLKKVQTLKTG